MRWAIWVLVLVVGASAAAWLLRRYGGQKRRGTTHAQADDERDKERAESSPMIDSLISSLKAGTLQIDCVEMILAQNTALNPITYKGSGYVRQNENGKLTFKLYAIEVTNTSALADLSSFSTAESGRIFGDADYYKLTARSPEGVQWTAEKILPKVDWGHLADRPIITSELDLISTTRRLPQSKGKHFVRLHFFTDTTDLPCNHYSKTEVDGRSELIRDRASFSAAHCDFKVKKYDDEFTITAELASPLSDMLPMRILESLQYLLAQSLSWSVLIRRDVSEHVIELVSPRARSAKSQLYPPLSQGPGYYEFSWKLFSLYLEYIIKTAGHPYWHHCSYHIHNACEASANSYDAWAVGVSVAVEGMANLLPVRREIPSKQSVKSLQNCIAHDLLSRDGYGDMADRIRGLIWRLRDVRIQDHIEPLVEDGYAERDHLKAWLKLRNKHVHPKEIDLQKLTMGDYQEMIDLINMTTVLMYHITFYLIGYRGKFTDYSINGFPAKDFPLQAPTSPA
jgi:hypothetical protein